MKRVILLIMVTVLLGCTSIRPIDYNSSKGGYFEVSEIPQLIPQGYYVLNMIVGNNTYSYVQMYNNSKWFTIASGKIDSDKYTTQNGIVVISDGANFRVVGSTPSFHKMYYRKY